MNVREDAEYPEPPPALADTVGRFAPQLAAYVRVNDSHGLVRLGLQRADHLTIARVLVATWFDEYRRQGIPEERAIVLCEREILRIIALESNDAGGIDGTKVRCFLHDALKDNR